ncbi:MAG: trypsin-like peptidase domain-containing protein [Bacteroidales bacterium]|nr:trypsin-like peptidase domain-containing protein [Bacteroidales bacterium]
MYREIWKKCCESVCQLSFYSSEGIKLLSITGFKAYGDFLVTDNYINKIYKATEVALRFVESDGFTEKVCVKMSMNEFKKRIIKDVDNKAAEFVAININLDVLKDIPSLKLNKNKVIEIGQPIALLGYQLEQDNLAIKTGILSSAFKQKNGLKYFQINSSIKQGNSGSPLVNAETGEVIGIIGYKLASITQSHKRMKQIINKNLAILKKSQGVFNVEEIDPVQVLIANQNQIKHITNEIYKTATMTTGFALDISYVHNLFEDFTDAEVSQSSMGLQIGV